MAIIGPEFHAAFRGLRRSPIFALASVAVLALASGATTAVLAIAHSLLLRPLPVVDQGQVAIA